MAYPFKTTYFDELYTSISSELMTQYPKTINETIEQWYKRLLYEYVSYIQSKYEPSTLDEKVNPNEKTNKKKTNPNSANFVPANPTIFDNNVEEALDVLSMDSDFSIYLFIEWFTFILTDNDWVRVSINMDHSSTAASNIPFKSIEFEIKLKQFKIIAINDVQLNMMKERYFDQLKLDPFLKAIFKIISFYTRGTTIYDYDTINDVAIVKLSETDLTTNSFKIGEILWKIKEITRPLFVSEIKLISNLIVENNNTLTVTKNNNEKSQRKKFNSRKYIKSTEATEDEKSSSIIQTLIISIFRTFYDFDPNNISEKILDYMFYGKNFGI